MALKYFRAKPSLIQNFMQAKGFFGTPYDASFGYFQSLSGLSEGTLYDHVNTVLINLGFSGTVDDMLGAFFQDQTGVIGRDDSERAFFEDTNNDFSGIDPGQSIIDESGNTIIDESGNVITN